VPTVILARGANAGATTADGRTPADLAPDDDLRALLA
jgi:hypothetical protein